jgi:hypothetical protein
MLDNDGSESYFGLDSDAAAHEFNLTLDLSSGEYYGDLKLLVNESGQNVRWDLGFSGTGISSTTVFLDFDLDGSLPSDETTDQVYNVSESMSLGTSVSGMIKGYFAGNFESGSGSSRAGLALGFSLSANGSELNGDGTTEVDRTLAGTLLLDADGTAGTVDTGFSTPESSTQTHNIGWGDWNNPIEDNWVVVTPESNGKVQIQTDDYLASVNPTPVANLTGAATYGSTLASDYIGSGSAGDVTQLVAGMDVDFNTGTIANGSLQVEVAGSQAWEIDFAGTINGGHVSLNSLGGTLVDPGGLVSNSINANLDGVFTGNNAEAFVGGFDMVDEINAMNHVNGLYTIEK